MVKEKMNLKQGGASLPAPPTLRPLELEELFVPARLDYLSFLLDEILWERRWGSDGDVRTGRRMINKELDRWELDSYQEMELAAVLAERAGLELRGYP